MSEAPTKTRRTMADIARRYDEHREGLLGSIRAGKVSASMSGIEYYPKPWAELDLASDGDRYVISTALTWNADEHTHDLTAIRTLTARELALRREQMATYSKYPAEREPRLSEIEVGLALEPLLRSMNRERLVAALRKAVVMIEAAGGER